MLCVLGVKKFSSLLGSDKNQSYKALEDGAPTPSTDMMITDVMITEPAQIKEVMINDSPKIILHCIRHAEGLHNDRHSGLTERQRMDLHDPSLTNLGVLQTANLCKSFRRMPYITHILCSPSRRTIQTATLSFRPLIKNRCPVMLLPQIKELGGELRCNQGSPDSVISNEFRHISLHFTALEQQPGWQIADSLGPSGKIDVHVSETRQLIYDMGKKFIEMGQLNEEGNIEMIVVGHAGNLGALMGYLTYEERRIRRWDNTEIRTFEFKSETLAEAEGKDPWNAFVEITQRGKAHLQPLSLPNQKELQDLGWEPKEVAQALQGLRSYHDRKKITLMKKATSLKSFCQGLRAFKKANSSEENPPTENNSSTNGCGTMTSAV